MSWMIVSDTSCEIRHMEDLAPGVQFGLVPFKIRVGEREFVDLPTLNVRQMLQAMTDYNGGSSTACPSPEEWAELFLQADNVIALTISHNLSGSYNAAQSAREMVLDEYPDKNIFILDTLSCAGALAEAACLANRLIGEGKDFEEVCRALSEHNDSGHILFALASFENLAKAGRVSKVVGFIAGALNMRVLGRRTQDGKIDFFFKTRARPVCWPASWSRWTRTVLTAATPCASAIATTKRPPPCWSTASTPSGRRPRSSLPPAPGFAASTPRTRA